MPRQFKLNLSVPAETIAPGSPVHCQVHLNENERDQLCERFNFLKLNNVSGMLVLAQIADGCWELTGQINVEITQACVVSQQPVDSQFKVELEERFVFTHINQIEINAMEVDVDLLVNGEIPVGECLCQWIGVCAPSWPRATNVPILSECSPNSIANYPFLSFLN